MGPRSELVFRTRFGDRWGLGAGIRSPSRKRKLKNPRLLRKEDIPVFVRIDPLFPHDPLPGGKKMRDFGLPDVQRTVDLEKLIRFCREVGVGHIVYSVAKITRPRRGGLSIVMEKMKPLFTSKQIQAWKLTEGSATIRLII